MRLALALCLFVAAIPQGFAAAEDATALALGKRLFPVVTALDMAQASASARAMLGTRAHRLAACKSAPACVIDAAHWSDEEISAAGALATAGERRDAVRRELQGLNAILDVYAKGATPPYPQIDGPVGEAGSARLADDVAAAVATAEAGRDEAVTRLDPSIGLALALIDANDRLDAIAFEPLDGGLNAEAFRRARTLDWSRYRYTAIIVLGAGPEDPLTPLSARGKLRLKLAARRYSEGLAPFVIVSGGTAHPRRTRFVEAVEMRRALIERYQVPAESIVIEPYARHTTTNLRNAARLLMRMKAPMDRNALALSDTPHIDSVQSPAFAERNRRELGYLPGRIGKRTSPFDVEFLPSPDSARVDPFDPLDP